jgi:hypothetical protein
MRHKEPAFVQAVRDGLTLKEITAALGVSRYAIDTARLRYPGFDEDVVAASEEWSSRSSTSIPPLRLLKKLSCPGEYCGTPMGYNHFSCREGPCRAAIREVADRLPSNQGKTLCPLRDVRIQERIISAILTESLCTAEELAKLGEREGAPLQSWWVWGRWDTAWAARLDEALENVRDPFVPHGTPGGYEGCGCRCRPCRLCKHPR